MTLQTKRYVLGFAFWREQVALIFKTKGPEYVIGTWNGIGGKIEADETGPDAMAREFFEETGVRIDSGFWYLFAAQRGKSWDGPEYELNCFVAHLPNDQDFTKIKNTEGAGEVVQWFIYDDYEARDSFEDIITPNLKWLLPLALDHTTGFLEIREH
jgi:8-oxo-dGTP diphosphatase